MKDIFRSEGVVQAVKIDRYTTMYNANKTGKGSPRLRVRVRDVPTRVAKQVTGRVYKNGAISVAKSNAKAVQALMAKAKFVNSTGFGAALTFAPTAAFDLVDTVDRDTNGDLQFHKRQFIINSAKNQSGNLVGYGAGEAAMWIVPRAIVLIFGTGTSIGAAPLLLIGFFFGIVVQAVWNAFGLNSASGSYAERIMESDWADIDTRFLCP